MKILFVTDGLFPFVIGGMQKHSTLLINQLARNGCELTVVHPGGSGYSQAALENVFSEFAKIEFILVPFPKFKKLPGHYIRENRAYSEMCLKAIGNKIKNFEVIYIQGLTGHAFFKLRMQNKIEIPVLLNLHGLEMFQPITGIRNFIGNYLLRRIALKHLLSADFVFSFGGKLTEILKHTGVQASSVLIQSNGISGDWLINKPEQHTKRSFIFIGRYERRKGIAELQNALYQLINEKVEFQFHFVGPIPESVRIKHPSVIYHGEIREGKRMMELLDKSDCIVVPSYSEGMPTVILEAMSRGLVVLATDVGAVSRMINNNGILIKSPAPELLSEALRKILNTTDERLFQMKCESIEMVKSNFLWSKIAEQLIDDLKEIKIKN